MSQTKDKNSAGMGLGNLTFIPVQQNYVTPGFTLIQTNIGIYQRLKQYETHQALQQQLGFIKSIHTQTRAIKFRSHLTSGLQFSCTKYNICELLPKADN